MSHWIKCDKCNKITKADSSGDKRYIIGVDSFDGYSSFHVCEQCLRSFYLDFLGWKWNDDENQYVPQAGSEDQGMTIEQIIKYLPAPICCDTVIGNEKQKEYDAHDSAVIILRKYQKIQEIVAKWKVDSWTDNLSYECMIEIAEIIDKAESEEDD